MASRYRRRTAAKTLPADPATPEDKSASADTPLDYLLKVMRDPAADPARRDEMAKLALPYMHAKPAAGDTSGKDTTPAEAAALSDIDIARRIAFTLAKAAPVASVSDEVRRPEDQPLGALGSR